MKVLITPRGFANYGTDIVKEMEAKGVTVHYNDTGKQYTPEQFLELANGQMASSSVLTLWIKQ